LTVQLTTSSNDYSSILKTLTEDNANLTKAEKDRLATLRDVSKEQVKLDALTFAQGYDRSIAGVKKNISALEDQRKKLEDVQKNILRVDKMSFVELAAYSNYSTYSGRFDPEVAKQEARKALLEKQKNVQKEITSLESKRQTALDSQEASFNSIAGLVLDGVVTYDMLNGASDSFKDRLYETVKLIRRQRKELQDTANTADLLARRNAANTASPTSPASPKGEADANKDLAESLFNIVDANMAQVEFQAMEEERIKALVSLREEQARAIVQQVTQFSSVIGQTFGEMLTGAKTWEEGFVAIVWSAINQAIEAIKTWLSIQAMANLADPLKVGIGLAQLGALAGITAVQAGVNSGMQGGGGSTNTTINNNYGTVIQEDRFDSRVNNALARGSRGY
jgi:hypothetical protein